MIKPGLQSAMERREYFRVNDTLGIRIRSIDDDSEHDIPASTLALLQNLSQADTEFTTSLNALPEASRELADCLRALAKRQDVLLEHLLTKTLSALLPQTELSLSAGGISFWHPRSWPLGSVLRLEILLSEPLALICCDAKVVQRHPENGGYDLGLHYQEISEMNRDLLAKRVLLAELRQRRARQQQTN